jgi:hypothetical protein
MIISFLLAVVLPKLPFLITLEHSYLIFSLSEIGRYLIDVSISARMSKIGGSFGFGMNFRPLLRFQFILRKLLAGLVDKKIFNVFWKVKRWILVIFRNCVVMGFINKSAKLSILTSDVSKKICV